MCEGLRGLIIGEKDLTRAENGKKGKREKRGKGREEKKRIPQGGLVCDGLVGSLATCDHRRDIWKVFFV